jgi:hypothetical protein
VNPGTESSSVGVLGLWASHTLEVSKASTVYCCGSLQAPVNAAVGALVAVAVLDPFDDVVI